MKQHDVIISGVHIDLTDALKNIVHEKVEKLFEHEERIIRLRVELGHDQTTDHQHEFTAKGQIEIGGNDPIATAASDNLYKSIDQMVDKLDRMLRRRSRLQKVKRKQPRAVDIPATIPKAV